MKKLFFTSNTKHYHKIDDQNFPNKIDNTNGIVDQIKTGLDNNGTILYIAASPEDIKKVDEYSRLIFDGFKMSGITFDKYLVLDNRTINYAQEYVLKANLIFLSGGDTYVENKFFREINLRKMLKNFEGTIIGQSAGSINLADDVYNSPEDGDQSEPIYFEGLGLSNINIEPHFVLNPSNFNEMEQYQREHILNESKKRPIYALIDGSHILENDNGVIIYGESYLIKDGQIIQLCNNGELKEI